MPYQAKKNYLHSLGLLLVGLSWQAMGCSKIIAPSSMHAFGVSLGAHAAGYIGAAELLIGLMSVIGIWRFVACGRIIVALTGVIYSIASVRLVLGSAQHCGCCGAFGPGLMASALLVGLAGVLLSGSASATSSRAASRVDVC